MQHRQFRNLPTTRQHALQQAFPWLRLATEGASPPGVQTLSVSVFDHWLSEDEARVQLVNVPAEEQARRGAQGARFCALVAGGTPVLSFVFRGRMGRRTVFREFTSPGAAAAGCTPGRQRPFQLLLPDLGCAFFEGWDDTHHFCFTSSEALRPVAAWAQQCGLFLLPGG